MKNRVIHIQPTDNVLVALDDLRKHEIIVFDNEEYFLLEDIPAKHKFFMHDLQPSDEIIMYGVLVGKPVEPIQRGARMTTENTHHAASGYAYHGVQYQWQPPDVSKFLNKTFNGYYRSDGKVGTAN